METKRINTSVPIGLYEINFGEAEKSSSASKSNGVAATKDLMEVAKQNNEGLFADKTQSSQQNQGTSGKKELGTNEQDQVSKEDVSKIEKPSYFVEDSRTRSEERKDSDLRPPFGGNTSKKEERGPKTLTQDQISSLYGTNSPEQSSDAVNDASRLVDGVNVRDALNQEVAKRGEERNAVGGSQMDRLLSTLDPTARGEKGQNAAGYNNKGGIAQDKSGGGWGYGVPTKDGEVATPNSKSGDNLPDVGKALGGEIIGQVNRVDKITSDTAKLNEDTTLIGETVITGKDGTRIIKGKDETVTVIKTIDGKENKTVTHKDGSSETYIDGKKDEKQSNSKLKSYNQENYTGNIPEEVKKLTDYFRQQAAAQKPQSGGELVQVDPNALHEVPGNGGPVRLTQTGETGMVGQPNRNGEDVGNASHFDGGNNPVVNGGYSDPGDGNNWTGRTIKDDPADVHFGPSTQPKEQTKTDKKDEKSSSSYTLLDELMLRRQARIR